MPFCGESPEEIAKVARIQHTRRMTNAVKQIVTVDTGVKVAGRNRVRLITSQRSPEHTSVIDEDGAETTARHTEEQGLPIVGVLGTNVQQPGQAECPAICDSREVAARKDFQRRIFPGRDEARSEAETREGTDRFAIGFKPASRITVEE